MGHDGPILVLLDTDPDQRILPVSLESISAGKKLAAALGGRLCVLLLGDPVAEAAREVSGRGVDAVYTVEHPRLENYQPEPFLAALLQMLDKLRPRAVIMGQTLISADLAPRLAFALGVGLISDCLAVEVDDGEARFIKPVYSGNVMAAYALTAEPYLLTVRSGAYGPPERGGSAQMIPVSVDLDAVSCRLEVVRRQVEVEDGPKLAGAEIIVSGGRGIGGPEGFEKLAVLAKLLNAALGASRPPCDLGWVSPKSQVGQTGEIVRPNLYIAVGISGATQHVAGMAAAGTIVAINKDPEAAIFKIADYGVAGRYEEVVPALTEALAKMAK